MMLNTSETSSTTSSDTGTVILEPAEKVLARLSDSEDKNSPPSTPIKTRKSRKKKIKKDKEKTKTKSAKTKRTRKHRRPYSTDSSSSDLPIRPGFSPPGRQKKTMAEILKSLEQRKNAASSAGSTTGDDDLERGSTMRRSRIDDVDPTELRVAGGLLKLLEKGTLTTAQCRAILKTDELTAATQNILTNEDSSTPTGDIKNPILSTGSQGSIGGLLLFAYQQAQEKLNSEENIWKTLGFSLGFLLIFVVFSFALNFWNHRRIKRSNKTNAAKEVLSRGVQKQLLQNPELGASTPQQLLNLLNTLSPSDSDPTRLDKAKAKLIPNMPGWLKSPI